MLRVVCLIDVVGIGLDWIGVGLVWDWCGVDGVGEGRVSSKVYKSASLPTEKARGLVDSAGFERSEARAWGEGEG